MSLRRALGCAFVLVSLAAFGAWAWRETGRRAERRLRAALEGLERRSGGRQRASFGSMELRPLQLGASLRVLRYETRGLDGEPLVLEADELRLERFRPEVLGGASDFDATLVGLRSAWLDRELTHLPILEDRFQPPCRIDLRVAMRYDPAPPRALRLDVQAHGPAVGSLTLRLATHGLSPQQIESASRLLSEWGRAVAAGSVGDEHALDALAGSALVEAEAVFRDGGLAPALLEREARRLGLTSEQARDKFRVDLWSRLQPGAVSRPWAQEAGGAAEAFVGDPRSLRVTLDPATPAAFDALPAAAKRGPQELAELLGFSAAANEAP